MTPRCWENWIPHYEKQGYRVLAPAYPGFDVEVEALRADPSTISALTVPETVAHLEGVIAGLDRPPIIIGHSFGGTLTQLLLDRGHGAAGVVINSAPTEGVRVTPLSQVRSLFPILDNPANPPQAGRLHPGAVPLHLLQHAERGGVGQGLRALPHPRPGELGLVVRTAGQLHAGSAGNLGGLCQRCPGSAAVHRQRCRSHHAGLGEPVERQALRQFQCPH